MGQQSKSADGERTAFFSKAQVTFLVLLDDHPHWNKVAPACQANNNVYAVDKAGQTRGKKKDRTKLEAADHLAIAHTKISSGSKMSCREISVHLSRWLDFSMSITCKNIAKNRCGHPAKSEHHENFVEEVLCSKKNLL
jgi:hypothetical protein